MSTRVAIVIAAVLVVSTSLASAGTCTKKEAQAAYVIVADLKSWDTIHSAYERFGHCDDGAIAGGFTESVSLMLSDQWNELSVLTNLLRDDRGFKKFVFLHLNEAVPRDRWVRIEQHAKVRCPKVHSKLCGEIVAHLEKLSANPLMQPTVKKRPAAD